MMRFSSAKASVHLKVLGYQFATLTCDEDTQWLVVQVEVNDKQAGLCWGAIDPCLMVSELEAIRDWLRSIHRGEQRAPTRLSFLEPCLALIYQDRSIGIALVRELHPNAAGKNHRIINDQEYTLFFEPDQEQLSALIRDVEELMAAYPQRSVQNRPPATSDM
ncbi:MAG: hypothetical protein Q4D79_12395 [Propionibacteriaceae bacterium]|nr:hypothetical protein [Propionibacteriaceae bacterium]